jgi:hypothetical protein
LQAVLLEEVLTYWLPGTPELQFSKFILSLCLPLSFGFAILLQTNKIMSDAPHQTCEGALAAPPSILPVTVLSGFLGGTCVMRCASVLLPRISSTRQVCFRGRPPPTCEELNAVTCRVLRLGSLAPCFIYDGQPSVALFTSSTVSPLSARRCFVIVGL